MCLRYRYDSFERFFIYLLDFVKMTSKLFSLCSDQFLPVSSTFKKNISPMIEVLYRYCVKKYLGMLSLKTNRTKALTILGS